MSDLFKDLIIIAALQDLARGGRSEKDLVAQLTQDLLKITVEASLIPKWMTI